jgi:hypothetical protein
MSKFKQFKDRDRIKTWESKIKRLYAFENMDEEDLKYINMQFELYKNRKISTFVLSFGVGSIIYSIQILSPGYGKRLVYFLISSTACYNYLRFLNRKHYETIITPYFEKYHIK